MFGVNVFQFKHAVEVWQRLFVLVCDLPCVSDLSKNSRGVISRQLRKLLFAGLEQSIGCLDIVCEHRRTKVE